MREYAEIKETLETRKDRSAWNKGVTIYSLELLEEYAERAAYEGRQAANTAEFKEWLKNGASDWDQYSWGGSSLIYNSDIAERLCCPSESLSCKTTSPFCNDFCTSITLWLVLPAQ